jgi:hypothetical protein
MLMIDRTIIVLSYFRRMNFVLFLYYFGNIEIMNLCLLSWNISWNLWSLKILINLFWFLPWNIFWVLIYNYLTLLIRHAWLINSFIWVFGLNIFILFIYPIDWCVEITFNCTYLMQLVLFLLVNQLYLFLTVS